MKRKTAKKSQIPSLENVDRRCRLRRKGNSLSPDEYEFFRVGNGQKELETCLNYEREMERAYFLRKAILAEADHIQEQPGNNFDELLQLQNRMDRLPRMCNWLALKSIEKEQHICRLPHSKKISNAPQSIVVLCKNRQPLVSPSEGLRKSLLKLEYKDPKRLELLVDWTKPTKQIVEAFGNLIKELRETDNIAYQAKETRGPAQDFKLQLLKLAMWRLRAAGFSPSQILNKLKNEPFKSWRRMSKDDILSKKLAEMINETEEWLFGKPTSVEKLVSGGQTGADSAALDFAIANDIPYGGWCPKGRNAEDWSIDQRYLLAEVPGNYLHCTEWNVRQADGTVIFTLATNLTGGSKRTAEFAAKHAKPFIHLSKEADGANATDKMLFFLTSYGIRVLNVSGSRESKEPGVGRFVNKTLTSARL